MRRKPVPFQPLDELGVVQLGQDLAQILPELLEVRGFLHRLAGLDVEDFRGGHGSGRLLVPQGAGLLVDPQKFKQKLVRLLG